MRVGAHRYGPVGARWCTVLGRRSRPEHKRTVGRGLPPRSPRTGPHHQEQTNAIRQQGSRNAVPRRATATPVGTRNLQPREPVVLPDEDEARGGDFHDCEWEHHRPARSALSVFLDEDDPSEAVAKASAKREQARIAGTEARAEREVAPAVAVGPGSDASGEDTADPPVQADAAADAGDHAAPPGGAPAEPVVLTPDEVRRLVRRDRPVWKRLAEARRERLRKVTTPDALAVQSCHTVVSDGAALRLSLGKALDAHAALYHSPLDEPREVR